MRTAMQDGDEASFRDPTGSLGDTLRGMIAAVRGETVSLRELLDRMGEHGLLMICAVLCLPFLLPVSVPGLSTVFGAAIVLMGLAVTLNRLPWLPARVLDRRIDSDRLLPALERGASLAARLDGYVKPRMPGMVAGPAMARLNGLAIVAGGVLLLWPLGLVPFSNTLPGVAVLLVALGMTQRDGAMVLAGYGFLLATIVYFTAIVLAAVAAGGALLA
jgi:hypothetical protein